MTSHKSAEALRAVVQRVIRGFGLLAADKTPCGQPLPVTHAHALMILLEADERGLTQRELQARLGIDKSNVSRVAAQLLERGHVRGEATEADLRLRRVVLTAKGARVAEEVAAASQARYANVLAQLPAARRTTVLEALGDLAVAIEALREPPAAPPRRTSRGTR